MMSVVFNLVIQQDTANSIDTKRNSTSMNAIAALTMVFLPGAFTVEGRYLPLYKLPTNVG